jgi:hypothetical protein
MGSDPTLDARFGVDHPIAKPTFPKKKHIIDLQI